MIGPSDSHASGGKTFVLKLVGKLFSKHELATSNYGGGWVNTTQGRIYKAPLDKVRLNAIIEQGQEQYPGELNTSASLESVRRN